MLDTPACHNALQRAGTESSKPSSQTAEYVFWILASARMTNKSRNERTAERSPRGTSPLFSYFRPPLLKRLSILVHHINVTLSTFAPLSVNSTKGGVVFIYKLPALPRDSSPRRVGTQNDICGKAPPLRKGESGKRIHSITPHY